MLERMNNFSDLANLYIDHKNSTPENKLSSELKYYEALIDN